MLITWRLGVGAYCFLIFILSSLRAVPRISYIPEEDKIIHVIEYGILSFLSYRMFAADKIQLLREHPYITSWLFTFFYGILDEFHQYFVPTRTFEVNDILADAVGAGLFLGILALFNVRAMK